MSPSMQISRRLRWAIPIGGVAITGGVLAASLVPTAQATPTLPSRTPAQLLAAVAGRTGPLPPMTGTVVETAALGLPDLPNIGDPTSLQSLLTGSHTIRVWYADQQHARLSIPGQLSETDLIRSGRDVWVWSSVQNKVTHYRLPAASGEPAPAPPRTPLTPQQAAQQVLAAVGPTTTVSVASNVTVAGEASYELVLAPKDSRSLVRQVRIAIDAARNVPLRVQVFARGAASPAFQTGFTSIAFTRPAAANFAFTPPAGATVVQGSPPATHVGAVTGGQVKVQPGGPVRVMVPGGQVKVLPGRPGRVMVRGGQVKVTAGAPAGVLIGGVPMAGGSTVVGQGWLAVAVMSAAATPPGGGPPGAGPAVGPELGPLVRAGSQVSGTWGSGRLLRTSLVSVLFTDDGRLLVGAVTPDVLYSAAAKTSHLAGR
jgi:outer membrane lipoprotein-sorting protein